MTEISEMNVARKRLIPFGRRIVVQAPPVSEESGIILPDSAIQLTRGIVVALPESDHWGEWRMFIDTDADLADDDGTRFGLSLGDVVLYRPGGGDEIHGERILDVEDIRAVER